MKVVELLKIGGELLKLMSENDVKRDDWRYVEMYHEYKALRANGVKYRSVIRQLADDYHTSVATVERILRRLGADC